jgi:hypothetical protein
MRKTPNEPRKKTGARHGAGPDLEVGTARIEFNSNYSIIGWRPPAFAG